MRRMNLARKKKSLPRFPAVYDTPCMIEAEKHVRTNDKHPNGVLGLWLSNVPELCIGFGPNVYETEIGPCRIGAVPYEELLGWHRFINNFENRSDQIEFYKRKRLELLETMDVFHVVDSNSHKRLGEVVVCNLNVIARYVRIPWKRKQTG